MKIIDKESQQFIDWTIKMLRDDNFFNEMVGKVKVQMFEHYAIKDKKKFLIDLRKKMKAGAIEHGKPTDSYDAIQTQIREEFLDLIGWNMVTLWRFKKRGLI